MPHHSPRSPYGSIVLFAAILLILFAPGEKPDSDGPIALELDRDRIRLFGTIMKIVSEEMIAVADCDDIEEHLIVKAERIFDDFAREADFPGPDFVSKPLARKMVRPIARSVIRYVDRKYRESESDKTP